MNWIRTYYFDGFQNSSVNSTILNILVTLEENLQGEKKFVYCIEKLFTDVMEANDDRSIDRFWLQRTDLQWDFLQFLLEIISNVAELMPTLSGGFSLLLHTLNRECCAVDHPNMPERIILIYRGDKIFHKSRRRFKILGARRVCADWGLTNIRRHGTKFSLSGDLAVGICAPLLISIKAPQWTKFCIIKCSNFNQ